MIIRIWLRIRDLQWKASTFITQDKCSFRAKVCIYIYIPVGLSVGVKQCRHWHPLITIVAERSTHHRKTDNPPTTVNRQPSLFAFANWNNDTRSGDRLLVIGCKLERLCTRRYVTKHHAKETVCWSVGLGLVAAKSTACPETLQFRNLF